MQLALHNEMRDRAAAFTKGKAQPYVMAQILLHHLLALQLPPHSLFFLP